MIHNERGIGDAHTGVLDERQLAPGPLAGIGRVDDLVRNPSDAQPGLKLAAEWAEVRNGEHARELEQLDGQVHGVRHVPDPSEARTANAPRLPSNPCPKRSESGGIAALEAFLAHML